MRRKSENKLSRNLLWPGCRLDRVWRMSSWIVPGKSSTKELSLRVNAADLIILSPAFVEPALSETQLPRLGKISQAHRTRKGKEGENQREDFLCKTC